MPTVFELKVDDYRLEFRLPNSLDISAVLNFDSNDDAQIQLLSRCIAKAESAGKEVAANKLPDEVFDVLASQRRMPILPEDLFSGWSRASSSSIGNPSSL